MQVEMDDMAFFKNSTVFRKIPQYDYLHRQPVKEGQGYYYHHILSVNMLTALKI